MNATDKETGRSVFFSELWHFMRERKKWWLGPLVGVVLLLILIVVLSESSVFPALLDSLF